MLILSLVTIPSMTRAQEASPVSTAASKEAPTAPADAGQKSGALPWWSPQNLFSLGSLEINSWRDVLQVGEGVAGLKPGQRVLAYHRGGGYAERVAVPAGDCVSAA